MPDALLQADLPNLKLHARGKVRDIYAVGDDLLLITTDRISAFDHILATGIPDKGKILTQISLFWFRLLADLVPTHLITADVDLYPEALQSYRQLLHFRSMLVKPAEIYPIECVVRGYLTGSAWTDYQKTGSVCGHRLVTGHGRIGKITGADLYPGDQGTSRRTRYEHHHGRDGQSHRPQ